MNFRGGLVLIKKSLFGFVASRAFFWTLSFGWMLAPLIYMFVWIEASGNGSISGYTKNDFITYYVFFIFVNQLTYPTSNWTVGDNIFNGTFSYWLLRPIQPIYEAIASDIATKVVCIPFVAVFILTVSIIVKVKITLIFTNVLIFILCLILAQILRFMFAYSNALLALMTNKIGALLSINETLVFLLAGQIIPTDLLPDTIRQIGNFLPYKYMLGFPIEVLLGKLSQSQLIMGIGIQVAWIAGVIVLHNFIWNKGIKHYTSVGG